MQAVRIHEFGGLDSLKVEDAPTPEAGDGEVLVRIHAAGINPVDWKTGRSTFPSMRLRSNSAPSPTWRKPADSRCTWTQRFHWKKCTRRTR